MKLFIEAAQKMESEAVALRRDLHKHPELAFCEYRTASKIIRRLQALGYDVAYGAAVMDKTAILSLPTEAEMAAARARACAEGADEALVAELAGGMTGVVATLKGNKPGKTVAFRFDMDCNDVNESADKAHRPAAEGFASLHEHQMHACGHDGHVTIGLVLAALLAERRAELCGTVKLIFQPAEEGVRGAAPMVAAGVVDDVDYFFGGHLGINAKDSNMLVSSTGGFLAVAKYAVHFTGKSSHAGLAPHQGKNALLAAAQATLALHAITRHGKGASRINVGVLQAGTGINVIADSALLQFEVRGETTEINTYMCEEAERILRAAAAMYDVGVEIEKKGMANSFEPDADFAAELTALADQTGLYSTVTPLGSLDASEDCTAFLSRVQERGGKASYMLFGTKLAAVHHNGYFDFDESVLTRSAAWLACLAMHYTAK